MAWVQSDADALKAAIATGALSVRYADGKTVTYRDLDDMIRTLALIEREVATTAGTARLPRGVYPGVASGVS